MNHQKSLQSSIEARLPETLDFLKELVDTNSHTFNAEGVRANAGKIAERFSPLGFSAKRLACNLPGTGDHLALDSGGDGPTIACVAHLDTVFPAEEEAQNNFRWHPEGDLIYGPGTYDIKGGTALLWLMLSSLAEADPQRFAANRWLLLWNAAEERLARDFAGFCLGAMPPDTRACLVFEGDNETRQGLTLVRGRKGTAKFHLRVGGRGAHAGNKHHEGVNAIRQLARLIEEVESWTDYPNELTFNVGRVEGGLVDNRVPHEAEAKFEMRAYGEDVFQDAMGKALGLSGKGDVISSSDGHSCKISVDLLLSVPPWSGNSETDRLVKIWQDAGRALGTQVGAARRGGISDANSLAAHLPTLDGLGPRGGNSHASETSPDRSKLPEFVDASSFVPKALLNLEAISKIR